VDYGTTLCSVPRNAVMRLVEAFLRTLDDGWKPGAL
jgi:hypothetical protein